MKHCITLTINSDDYTILVYPTTTLVDAIREETGLTGTKKGCGGGECGACTVLINDQPVASCMMLAFQAQGSNIVTIEGLEHNGELDAVQEAYAEMGAVQCGFCSPGFIMTTAALLKKNSSPTPQEVRKAVAGNLCRCTGYQKIVDAVIAVPNYRRQEGK